MTATVETTEEFTRPFTGMMHTLDKTGDTRTIWDKDNADEVAIAKKQFADFMKKGYLAYKAEGKDGRKGEQIREFDPDAERIIFARQLVGG